jgi:aminoglycoside phosphotransferase (APT) family kinase protein
VAAVPDLEPWLRGRLGEPDLKIVDVAPFGDGHSGFTYLVRMAGSRAQGEYVMRLSPPGARILANADVGRQGRIMAALHERGFPTPRVLLADSSGSLDGRAVAIMERIDGLDWEQAARQCGELQVMRSAVSVLHRLARIPIDSVGLPGETPSSIADDLDRWARLLRRAPEDLHADGERLLAELQMRTPAPVAPSLVHGDYHYGNLLFAAKDAEVVGVLDWEVSGLGDPRWDFGSLAVAAIRHKYADEPNPTGDLEGISVTELAQTYGPMPGLDWFAAAACFKYTAILGYNYGLHLRGRRPDPIYEQLQGTIHGLSLDGLDLLHA